VQWLQETDRWASPKRDYKLTQTSRAGLLTGLPAFDLGIGLSVRPSITGGGGVPAPAASVERRLDASLDATQRVGANTLASLTVNTDFAETEVDQRRTNLTRFPLFFPEKRTFFLEGADIFDFGLGTGQDVMPFHSRRLGLLSGRQVPIDVGAKVNGRIGGTNFGALAVRSRSVDSLAPATTAGIIRIKQNVLGESSVGAIATVGDPLGRPRSWLVGTDFAYQTSHFRGDKNFGVGVWGLATDRDSLVGKKQAFGAKIDYPNDLWDASFTYKWVGDGFQPALGFVPQRGVQIYDFNVDFSPRPRNFLHVRKMSHELQVRAITGLDGQWTSYEVFTAPINWRFDSGDGIEFNVIPQGERFDEPFDVAKGIEIPGGAYHSVRYRLEGKLAAKRRVGGDVSWRFGNFYDGTLDQLKLTTSWKPNAALNIEVSGEHNTGRVSVGRFTKDRIGTRLRINVSPDLQFNSFIQYDNDSRSIGSNSRLRWTFRPVGDLFVIYNHNMNELLDTFDRHRGWAFASNELLVKLQYAFRY
jgi:hypothetical protein